MKVVGVLLVLVTVSAASGAEWQRLTSLPDREGFAGSFAGVSGGALLVAGGTNFPEKKPWEGGQKVWYDTIFVLDQPHGEWQVAGKLPRPLGYGVSVTHRNSVVCVGGSDAQHHYADAFRLEWQHGKVVTSALPSLPLPVANACGALVGDTLYVAGGQAKPDASVALKTVYRIDLSATEPQWKEVEPCPGSGRILAVAAGFDGSFWLMGGADLAAGTGEKVERHYLKEAYRFDPDKGWRRLADLPRPVVGAPSPAPTDPSGFSILGGDDGSQVGAAPDRHRGFSKAILRFDVRRETWSEAATLPAAPVTVPCVRWGNSWVIPGGEERPGRRTPQVWSWTPEERE